MIEINELTVRFGGVVPIDGMNATMEVLSRPVAGGGDPGRETSTKRVSASGLSPMPFASVASR